MKGLHMFPQFADPNPTGGTMPLRCRWFGHSWDFKRYEEYINVRCSRCGKLAIMFRAPSEKPASDMRFTLSCDASQMNGELDRIKPKLEEIERLSRKVGVKAKARTTKRGRA
jgi:hypothetical protein